MLKTNTILPSHMRLVALIFVFTLFVATAALVTAAPKADVIVLPGAKSTEGIASGRGSTYYAGEIFTGDIFSGDLQKGTAELFIDAPEGRQAAGMYVDQSSGLLFVAGGFTGQGYVYDIDTGQTVAVYQFDDPEGTLINDVVVTRDGAWFTDTFQPQLYFVPVGPGGELGEFSTLELSGPAAEINGQFNLNGIRATQNGSMLIVGHTNNAKLYTVNPLTGESAEIAGASVPNNDGILLEAGHLWVVQNFNNQIAKIRLSNDLSSGTLEEVITSPHFQVPATAALFGNKLAAVNAKFDTGFPPTATQYEVVIVER